MQSGSVALELSADQGTSGANAKVERSSHGRLIRKLRDALGEPICRALEDTSVVEIMLNPDGRLFVERLGRGMEVLANLEAGAAEIIIGSVAHALQTQADADQPIISGELPIGGHRFEGLLPPVVSAPSFTIRRRASQLIPMEDYVRDGIMTPVQASAIREGIAGRLNIVICGGTGSGKTTLANAVIAEIVTTSPQDRIVILEDTSEIQCAAENAVALHTTDAVDMARLLKSTMRLRPDRIIVGEVRDGAALTLLKAWNTGHPGGIATVHANSTVATMDRLCQLIEEAIPRAPRQLVAEAIDVCIHMQRNPRHPAGRSVTGIDRVVGSRPDGGWHLEPLV